MYKFHNRNVGQPTLKKKRPTLLDWIYFKWTYVQCCILFFSVNNQCYVYKKEGCMHIQRFCEAVFWQTNKRLNVMDWKKDDKTVHTLCFDILMTWHINVCYLILNFYLWEFLCCQVYNNFFVAIKAKKFYLFLLWLYLKNKKKLRTFFFVLYG